jgi:hypothetical protein
VFLGRSPLIRLVAGAALALVVGMVLVARGGASTSASSVRHLAPEGKDSNPCTASAPCASFARAYRVAAPGDVIEVAAGSYPAQTLPADPSKESGAAVVFRPAEGATVALAAFTAGNNRSGVGPKHFELRDMRVAGLVVIRRGADDVTLRNVDAGTLGLTSTRGVRLYGGDYGPWVNGVSHINACGDPGCFPAEDILIDGALFHDFTITDPAKHSECLMIWPGRRVTIRNSTFRNCTDFDVLVKPYNTGLVGLPGDITLENNFFDDPMPGATATASCNPGCPRGGNAIAITDGSLEAWSGVQIRYNSLLGGIRVDTAVTGVTVTGNVARKDANSGCLRTVTFAHNVWSGARCAPSDRTAALSNVFVDPSSSGFDLRLRLGSRAVAAGDTADHPKLDIKGRLRPVGFAPDAGAWQREPALVVSGRAVGTATIGASRAQLVEFYGKPRKRTKTKQPDGTRLPVDEWRVRGGMLRITYRDEKAVAVATTSAYYRTARGLRADAPLRAHSNEDGRCRPVGGRVGRARIYVRPTRAKKPVVAELTVVAARFTPLCALPPSER